MRHVPTEVKTADQDCITESCMSHHPDEHGKAGKVYVSFTVHIVISQE